MKIKVKFSRQELIHVELCTSISHVLFSHHLLITNDTPLTIISISKGLHLAPAGRRYRPGVTTKYLAIELPLEVSLEGYGGPRHLSLSVQASKIVIETDF